MELKGTEFSQVRLGAIFFDPSSGKKFQKVDTLTSKGENKHGNKHNAIGCAGGYKNFSHTHKVKAHKSRILNYAQATSK